MTGESISVVRLCGGKFDDFGGLLGDRKRGAVFPVGWKTQRRDVHQVIGFRTLRIQRDHVPVQDCEFVGGRRALARAGGIGGREVVVR